MVASAQGTISIEGEATLTSEEGATSGEGTVGAEGRDPNAYPSGQAPATGRGPEDREPRPEERGVPNLIERQETAEVRSEQKASTTEQRQETKALNVEQRQALRLERQASLQDGRQQRVLNLSANISNRMDAAIERIFDIISRTEQRVEKLKASGVSTVSAEIKLRESAQILAEARASILDIDNIVYNATTSAEPVTEWQKVKATYKNTAALIRASHAALRETIALLKVAVNEASLNTSAAVQADASAGATTTQVE